MKKYHKIVTHPGGAHKDEFLACCLLLAEHPVGIERREPTQADLDDPSVAVVDVGFEDDAERGNFDHHQFPKDHPPMCALSLVMKELGIYEDGRQFCEWLEPAEWFDTRGPKQTAEWIGVSREQMAKLQSPIDVTLVRRFASVSRLLPGEALWQMMQWIGEDLIQYIRGLRQRLDFIDQHHEIWRIELDAGVMHAIFLPRSEEMLDEPSSALARYLLNHELADSIQAMVYPDRRGNGYGLSRFQDSQDMDFTKIADCEDVHFAHVRGFVAKTSATDLERLQQLLVSCYAPANATTIPE